MVFRITNRKLNPTLWGRHGAEKRSNKNIKINIEFAKENLLWSKIGAVYISVEADVVQHVDVEGTQCLFITGHFGSSTRSFSNYRSASSLEFGNGSSMSVLL